MVSPGICEIERKSHPVKGLQGLVSWGAALRELEGKERLGSRQGGQLSAWCPGELCQVCRAATDLQMMLLSARY